MATGSSCTALPTSCSPTPDRQPAAGCAQQRGTCRQQHHHAETADEAFMEHARELPTLFFIANGGRLRFGKLRGFRLDGRVQLLRNVCGVEALVQIRTE